ncbi:putative heparinase superfamily protein [Caulobacter ginsengisoli]|uniref:Heparinase superfamily protein n=1 Tax=Caulobacter ginsengisoli TaxID=400775 RepID=A0ABU0ITM7_9CAUL|nr:heparinase II/III family protein [Caulobacter ginsengisoli]MDQ0465355.1 putative heparinase superfamily protein [Caulobacter ginsengisoli]
MARTPVLEPLANLAGGIGGALRRQGEREWFGNPLHRLAIASPAAQGLAANPHDLRPVNPARGRQILAGQFELAGAKLLVGPGGDPWDRALPHRRFGIVLHRMGWMGDLLSVGPEAAAQGLRLVLDWRRVFGKWNRFSWGPDVLERRVFNLACAARRLAAGASDAEAQTFTQDLARQARHLTRIAISPDRHVERAVAAGVAGCALAGEPGEALIDYAMDRLKAELPEAVRPDGVHASRSPERGLELLFDLMTLDEALHQRGQAGPDEINRAIDRLTAALRFFTLPDGALPVLQGGEARDPRTVAAAVAHDEAGRGGPSRAAFGGFQRLDGGGLTVLADAAPPAQGRWSVGACAQPLAIEIVCGADRLVTACGWSPDAAGPGALRLIDAASTAHLGELITGGPLQGLAAYGLGPRLTGAPRQVEARRHDSDVAAWLELFHDGWVRRTGLVHERRLYLDKVAGELRGEDSFAPKDAKEEARPNAAPRRYMPFAVRFHLHPDCRASIARDNKSILLRGPSDQGWWLRNDAAEVSLQPSAHFEDGQPHRAQQIVLKGQVRLDKGGRIRWKLSRAEG